MDQETGQLPDGVGVAVSADGKMVLEGAFDKGQIRPVYRYATDLGLNNLYFQFFLTGNDGRYYQVKFYKAEETNQIIFDEATALYTPS